MAGKKNRLSSSFLQVRFFVKSGPERGCGACAAWQALDGGTPEGGERF